LTCSKTGLYSSDICKLFIIYSPSKVKGFSKINGNRLLKNRIRGFSSSPYHVST
jgi:hypothetical protein